MRGFLIKWVVNTFTLLVIPYIITGIEVGGPMAAVVAALVLGIVNAFIRPVFVILALPIQLLTLGLFTFVVNALMLLIVSGVVKGFTVHGFWPALWGSIVLSIISGVLTWAVKDRSR